MSIKIIDSFIKKEFRGIIISIIIFSTIIPVFGLLNPAGVYCEKLGYTYEINQTEEGAFGICQFPDSSTCGTWDFLKGKCGKEFSYCIKEGYEIKTISDSDKCSSIYSKECAVCVLENGIEIEVTKLMNLSFQGSRCGDGICVLGENYENCPQDCSKSVTCGNKKCETGETQENCCIDCGCPSRKRCVDNKCQKIEKCGNGRCEESENCSTCPQDCRPCKIEKCGNGRCEENENYENCPKDCPSGSEDEYCDKVEEGICDPDCSRSEDKDCLCNKNEICEPKYEDYLNCPEDCKKPLSPLLIISIPTIIAIFILIFLIYLKSKKYERNY